MRRPCSVWPVLILVVPLLLAGCAADDGDIPRRPLEAGPSSSPPPSTSTTGVDALPPGGGDLTSGRHTTSVFTPTVSFDVGKGWQLDGPETEAGFQLSRGSDPVAVYGDNAFAISRVERVLDDPLITDRELTLEAKEHFKPAPADLVAFLRADPWLTVSEPRAVEVGGVSGVTFDVTTKDLPDEPRTCPDAPFRCVRLFPLTAAGVVPFNVVITREMTTTRMTLLKVQGEQVLITVDADPDPTKFENYAAEVARILDTLTFDGP